MQRGLAADQIFYLSEHAREFPGVRLAQSYLRNYPYQCARRAGARLRRRRSRPERVQDDEEEGYQPTDSIGQGGIESTYDAYLRGKDGKAQLTVDSRGRPKGAITPLAEPRRPGRRCG